MKFLYKIWSGYDGFTPRRIPGRLQPPKVLPLGWDKYLDTVEEGHEVWVYFHGRGVSPSGVYAKGFVRSVDAEARKVYLRVREYDTERPLTDAETTERIADVVRRRGLQVFVYPEAWDTPPECNIDFAAESCRLRHCESCAAWKQLRRVDKDAVGLPRRFPSSADAFAPAYWVIPPRCYLHYEGKRIAAPVERTSEIFYRFKAGERNLAYPLALGIYQVLRARRILEFDCIVPIPLSPDKSAKNEINRTRLLADELSPLLDAPVKDLLSLNAPISKRRLRTDHGYTANQFEQKYYETLTVEPRVSSYERLLLLDDVSTEGSTVRCAVRRIHEKNPDAAIVVATAGQMIVKHVVAAADGIVRH